MQRERIRQSGRSLTTSATGRGVSTAFALLIAIHSTLAFGEPTPPMPPGLGYVYPLFVKIGATTDVTLGGYDWTDDMQWFVHDPRVKLETTGPIGDYRTIPPPYWVGTRAGIAPSPIPREISARIECPADAKPGPVFWQVANANGSSKTAVFYLSDANEIVESRSRDLPQVLPALPVAICGRISRLTEIDRYEVTAAKSGLISVDLMARRLGSNFQAMLEVHDAQGQLLVDLSDTLGRDGGLTFATTAGETYTISLHDADFRGDFGYIYRLALTEGPRVITTLPAMGQFGTTTNIEFVGIGLATGAAREESVTQAVTFPPAGTLASIGPAATHRHAVQTPFGSASFDIPLGLLREQPSSALGPAEGNSLFLPGPTGVTGRFAPNQTEARYAWDAVEKETWSVSGQSQAIHGSLDVILQVLDPQGKLLVENDDRPGTSDAGLEFLAPVAGRYTAVIRSSSPRTDALSEVYRFEIDRAVPDFRLTLPQQIEVPLAGKVEVKIAAQRLGGFAGPIAVTVEGLPAGSTATGDWTIPEGKNELTATIEAAADADVVAGVIRFQGQATIAGAEVTHPAAVSFGGNLATIAPEEVQRTECMLSVTMPAPFEIKVVDRQTLNEIPRGTTFLAPLEVVRNPGFTGDLKIAMNAQQDRHRRGARSGLMPVPAGATRIAYPMFMPEWLGVEWTTRIVVHGVGAVPDPKGRVRYLTRAGDSRITMLLEGALMKLECPTPQIVARPGDEIKVPLTIARSVKLPLPATVEFVIPDELQGIVECDPVTFSAETSEGVLTVRTKADAHLDGRWSWTFTATSLQDGQWPVVSQTDLDVLFETPKSVAMP